MSYKRITLPYRKKMAKKINNIIAPVRIAWLEFLLLTKGYMAINNGVLCEYASLLRANKINLEQFDSAIKHYFKKVKVKDINTKIKVKPLEKLDIVLSIFNQEDLIERVLYGIFKNTTTPFNLILIFDGCTDNTKPLTLEYIKKHRPERLNDLIIRDTPNVYETRANNVGFKLAKEDYMITLQDDMVIKEYGWERRLAYPLRKFDDVLAVTSRSAHDIKRMDKGHEEYTNFASRETGTLPKNVFVIRDIINRGPVAFRMDYLRRLDYLNENYAPCNLDEADLSLRAWEQYGWRVGSFWIDYKSPVEWGKARDKDSTMPVEQSNTKNRENLEKDHGDYIKQNLKHSENRVIAENEIDYQDTEKSYFERMIYFLKNYPKKIDRKELKMITQKNTYLFLKKAKNKVKNILSSIIKLLFKISGQEDKLARGIKNYLYTDVGIKNEKTREAWLEKTLADLPAGLKILDAGAGECRYQKFCGHLEYVSQDFGEYAGKSANDEGLHTDDWDYSQIDIKSDITNMPVADNNFDAVMSIEVLEHVANPEEAVREMARVLKPDGILILTAPFCSLTHMAPYYFANGLSKYWYETILPKYGLRIEELVFNGNYFEYLAQELRRLGKVQFRYTNLKLTKKLLFKCAYAYLLRALGALSKANIKSEELLCFGLQIKAKKIR